MELHESLYALGRSQGRELFNDADSFRGALDDYLDEDSATTGDINLLVDAVRLGAYQAMITMLDSGADADRAVTEAGNRLARDRGSADVGGAKWALAVLGYATGKVSDTQVRTYRTQHASAPVPPPAGPPTVLPPAGTPVSSPPSQPISSPAPPGMNAPPATTPVWPSSGPQPSLPASAPAPTQVPGGTYGTPPPASYGGYGHAAPRKQRKVWPIVVGGVAAVVLIGGGVVAGVVVLSGDDENPPSNDGKTTLTTAPPPGVDVTFDALNERYQSLAALVTSGMDECVEGDPQSGQTEKVQCTFPAGTLVLTTYTSDAELKAARQRRLNFAEGTIVSNFDSGAYYRFDPKVADDASTAAPIVYWDSQAGMQSAELTGGTGTEADQLDPAFEAVSATVTPPDGATDVAVTDFNSLFGIVNCQRIPTEVDGESEESECRRSGRRTYVGKFGKITDLRQYRQNAKTLAGQDGDLVVDYWYNDDNSNGQQDAEEPEEGKIYGYIEEQEGGSNFGVLYIDDLDCRCYLQMYDKGQADPENLYDLIF
jgi:hypothetical protein